jgi:hypothetical protein
MKAYKSTLPALLRSSLFLPGVVIVGALFLVGVIFLSAAPERELTRADLSWAIEKASTGVCPPFNLYDEDGNLIDPMHDINATMPYSPKQTCGKCHDYNKITEGFHFQQGKGESPTPTMVQRYQWVTSPGNYGGTWCSPAPVYRQLANKTNASARTIDMTSFDFVTATCGTCHPGGGPLEFDRDGKRYDRWMKDSSSRLTPGGENHLDGDYYKARWSETGVLEADCMLCHLPEYDYKGRNTQLEKLNFKWAATQASGLATIEGSIKDKNPIAVHYDASKFDTTGKLSLHLVREPRNETCLNCHAKPDWKKRGTTFSARRDVHIAAGLKCVDCHPAGSHAADERVRGKEVHQFGKGDDPSGNVRNDLDNTVRDCKDCHLTGYLNAPIAKHGWLPSLHLEKIACQTCHINERPIKSALVQVSDVYNSGAKISPPPKHIWTFYDQNMNYWNHYGELNMFTAKDEPTDPSRPIVARYKGMIYPVNPVHSAWPAILTDGKPGLDQPTMKDVFTMWTGHNADSTVYPLLSSITDDNGDGIPEVNRVVEIDAIITSVEQSLQKTGYDLAGKRIVWVNNDRVYTDGSHFTTLSKEDYESSPYASVYKYSHDVAPAKAALGEKGCSDCHSFSAPFFQAEIVKYPFGIDGKPVTEEQHTRLGLSAFTVAAGAFREQVLKSILYVGLGLLVIGILAGLITTFLVGTFPRPKLDDAFRTTFVLLFAAATLAAGLIAIRPDLSSMILPDRLWLDSHHFAISMIVLLLGLYTLSWMKAAHVGSPVRTVSAGLIVTFLGVSIVTGLLMLLKVDALRSISYTLFDLSIVGILMTVLVIYAFSVEVIHRKQPETVRTDKTA